MTPQDDHETAGSGALGCHATGIGAGRRPPPMPAFGFSNAVGISAGLGIGGRRDTVMRAGAIGGGGGGGGGSSNVICGGSVICGGGGASSADAWLDGCS